MPGDEKESGTSHSPAAEFTSCTSIQCCGDSCAAPVMHTSEELDILKSELPKPCEDDRHRFELS